MKIRPVILCGGSGTRLWPLSTPQKPKQFLALTGSESMIALTANRLQAEDAPFSCLPTRVIGSAKHGRLLREALPEAEIILEPFGRNSAPAIAAAALVSDPDELLLILPADHHIADAAGFRAAVATGAAAALQGDLVTFGVKPDHPSTAYGYIRTVPGRETVHRVEEFVEKPPLETARDYVSSGAYFWNAGIFLFRAGTMIDAFETHAGGILSAVRAALARPASSPRHLEPSAFAEAENISIDYAIMEQADNISLVPVDIGWSDVGGYDALWSLNRAGDSDTVIDGPVVAEKVTDSYLRSEGPVLAVSGVDNAIIIATPDHVMISSRADADAVKRLGAGAQARPLALGLSGTTRRAAKQLLWTAFDRWADCAWDPDRGGFVESLDLDARPNTKLTRRVRVQARQVFSFSEAIRLGWSDREKAAELVARGLDYLDTACRHDDGGWVHLVSPDGGVEDPTRDLYDHAFILTAGAAAARALDSGDGKRLAIEALDFINTHLRAPDGGYTDSDTATETRRANPHMHLLEAFLEWHDASAEPIWLDRAGEMVSLFERHLFDPDADILREHLTAGWKPASGGRGSLFEPGHHYEWATLLADHARRTEHDSASWRRRLIARADRDGRDSRSGFAHNEVRANGAVTNPNRRLWPQLEAFRARLWHPGTAPPGAADRAFAAMMDTYFSGVPGGTWCDETDAAGHRIAKAIPASMLYHLVTAFRDILPEGDADGAAA